MRHFLFLGLLVASVLFCRPASACTMPASICESPIEGALPLIEGGEPAGILIDATADPALHHVAEDFAEDLGRVGGHVGRIAMNPENAPRRVVIIGVAGESPLIDSLVERYCAMTGLTNKSEAVRRALAAQIETLSQRETLAQRVAKVQAKAAAAGVVADGRDDKDLMDDLWGES